MTVRLTSFAAPSEEIVDFDERIFGERTPLNVWLDKGIVVLKVTESDAFGGERMIGFLAYYIYNEEHAGSPNIHIWKTAVEPNHRGRGIFSELLIIVLIIAFGEPSPSPEFCTSISLHGSVGYGPTSFVTIGTNPERFKDMGRYLEHHKPPLDGLIFERYDRRPPKEGYIYYRWRRG